MKIHITKEGKAEHVRKLEHLKVKRREIIREIAIAREHAGGAVAGGTRRNPEYHLLIIQRNHIESQIHELEGILANCQVIDPAVVNADGRCIFGSYVRLRDEQGGEKSYRLVGECEANADIGRISTTSPTGRALIGKYAGEFVSVSAPCGIVEYELLEVRYEDPQSVFPVENVQSQLSEREIVADNLEAIAKEAKEISNQVAASPAEKPMVEPAGFWRTFIAALLSFFGRSPRK